MKKINLKAKLKTDRRYKNQSPVSCHEREITEHTPGRGQMKPDLPEAHCNWKWKAFSGYDILTIT